MNINTTHIYTQTHTHKKKMEIVYEEDAVFRHPFRCMIAGPSESGKTNIIKNLIFQNQKLIYPPPNNICYCYAKWQPKYDEILNFDKNIKFIKGLPDISEFDPSCNNLLILDDMIKLCVESEDIFNLFTTDSHHQKIAVFLVTQNIFEQGKYARSISINCNYLILMNNPRDKRQITDISGQMFPKKSNRVVEAYEDAVSKPYGYLFIDNHQQTDHSFRLQSGITKDEKRIVYYPN